MRHLFLFFQGLWATAPSWGWLKAFQSASAIHQSVRQDVRGIMKRTHMATFMDIWDRDASKEPKLHRCLKEEATKLSLTSGIDVVSPNVVVSVLRRQLQSGSGFSLKSWSPCSAGTVFTCTHILHSSSKSTSWFWWDKGHVPLRHPNTKGSIFPLRHADVFGVSQDGFEHVWSILTEVFIAVCHEELPVFLCKDCLFGHFQI